MNKATLANLKNFFSQAAKLPLGVCLLAIVSFGTPAEAGFRWKNDRGQLQFGFDKAQASSSSLISTPGNNTQASLPGPETQLLPTPSAFGGRLEEFTPQEEPQKNSQTISSPSWRDKFDFKRSHKLQSQSLNSENKEERKKEREERKKAHMRLKDIEKENKLLKEQQKLRDNVLTSQVKLYELNKKPTVRQKVFSKLKPGKSKHSSMTWQAL